MTNEVNEIKVWAEEDHGSVWMTARAVCNSCKNNSSHIASCFIYPPNFIEELFGVTWESKLVKAEKRLVKKLLKKDNGNSHTITCALDKFLNKNRKLEVI